MWALWTGHTTFHASPQFAKSQKPSTTKRKVHTCKHLCSHLYFAPPPQGERVEGWGAVNPELGGSKDQFSSRSSHLQPATGCWVARPAPPRAKFRFLQQPDHTAQRTADANEKWRVGLPRCGRPFSLTGRVAGAVRSTANARLSCSVVAAAVACVRSARFWERTAATRWAWPRRRLRACRWEAARACTAGLGGRRLSTGVTVERPPAQVLPPNPVRPGKLKGALRSPR